MLDWKDKHPIVICVGPDKTGKSHIARALSNKWNIPVYKASTERASFLNNQDRFMYDLKFADVARLDLLKQLKRSVIFDRGYPCEFVYATYYRRQTDHSMISYLDYEYSALGAKIIVFARHSYDRVVDDLDPKLNGAALKQIEELYDQFVTFTKCSTHKIYVDDENLEREIQEIEDFVNGQS